MVREIELGLRTDLPEYTLPWSHVLRSHVEVPSSEVSIKRFEFGPMKRYMRNAHLGYKAKNTDHEQHGDPAELGGDHKLGAGHKHARGG